MERKSFKALILALVFLSLGGLLLHLRIHPVFEDGVLEWEYLIPPAFGLLTVILLPFLFWRKDTADLAYLLAGVSVIFGIIIMSHLSIVNWQGGITIFKVLFTTTLADSLMLLSKFFVARAIFNGYYPERTTLNYKFPQNFRFLFDGWWLPHFIAIGTVYSLGVVLSVRGVI